MTYRAVRCLCGHVICKDWHVTEVADLQGVKFTEEQATLVARVLNNEEAADKLARTTGRELEARMVEAGVPMGGHVLVIMPRNLGPTRSMPRGYASLWATAAVVAEWSGGQFIVHKNPRR